MTLKLLIILDVGIHFINEARALVARPRSMCRNASLARSRRLYDKLDLESCIFSVHLSSCYCLSVMYIRVRNKQARRVGFFLRVRQMFGAFSKNLFSN